MVKNFTTDNDLKPFYPLILASIWSTQSDFSTQRNKSFDIMINDLWNRGLNPRQCMIALDLNRAEDAENNQPLTSVTKTAVFTGEAFLATNQRRFVVKPSVCTGTFIFQLQGSNEAEEPDSSDSSWEDVGSALSFASTTAEQSVVITNQCRWYRYKITSVGTTCTYTACMYETIFDDAIIHRSLAMIFNDYSQSNPQYAEFYKIELAEYDNTMTAIKFYYDTNDNGIPESTDLLMSAGVRFTR